MKDVAKREEREGGRREGEDELTWDKSDLSASFINKDWTRFVRHIAGRVVEEGVKGSRKTTRVEGESSKRLRGREQRGKQPRAWSQKSKGLKCRLFPLPFPLDHQQASKQDLYSSYTLSRLSPAHPETRPALLALLASLPFSGVSRSNYRLFNLPLSSQTGP